jgi:hypothetical protein
VWGVWGAPFQNSVGKLSIFASHCTPPLDGA